MSKKIIFLFLSVFWLWACLGAMNQVPSKQDVARYLSIAPQPQSIYFTLPQLQRYRQAKLFLDSYLKDDRFDQIFMPITTLKSENFRGVFGYLNECECDIFARKTVPIRGILEKELFANFKICKVDKSQPIIYTSVGSGGLFQDLIIITKLLECGYQNIIINLIDEKYREFMKVARSLKSTRCPYFVKKNAYESTDSVESSLGFYNEIFYYFMHWLTFLQIDCYKKLTFNVFIYDSLDSYLDDCDNGFNMQCDIGIITDFDGGFGVRDKVDGRTLFMEYLHPFYCTFFDCGIKDGGIYGFALIGDFSECSLRDFTGGPIWSAPILPPTDGSDEPEYHVPTCFCGIKQTVSI